MVCCLYLPSLWGLVRLLLGVRLLEADDSGVTIQDTSVLSLVIEVKARQQEDPSLEQLRAKTRDQQSLAFDIKGDRVLR